MRQHAGLSLVWFSPHLRERTRSYRQRAVARRAGEKRRANESRSGGTGLTFSRPLAFVLLLTLAPALAACGSGPRQDKNEPSGTWKVDVPTASFPGKQRLAEQSQLRITVENLDSRAIPDLAVTVDGFGRREESRQLADPERPVWAVDTPPQDSVTAYTNTWALGKVPARESRTFIWTVTAVRAGTYTVRWRVAAGLNGKAKAQLPDGSAPTGSFVARVSDKPRPPKID